MAINILSKKFHKSSKLASLFSIDMDTIRKWYNEGEFLGFCKGKVLLIEEDSFSDFIDRHTNSISYKKKMQTLSKMQGN